MSEVLVAGRAGGVGSVVVDMLLEWGCGVVATVLNSVKADAVAARRQGRVPTDIVDLPKADAACAKIAALIGVSPGIAAAVATYWRHSRPSSQPAVLSPETTLAGF